MQRISLKDKKIFDNFFSLFPTRLSMYSFASIFVWNRLFDIYWEIIDASLCIFFENELGMFLPVEPLGELTPETVEKVFYILSRRNKNDAASRIENISESGFKFYESCRLKLRPKAEEYIYDSRSLSNLVGNNFKSKRSSYNFFVNNYSFDFEKLDASMKNDCLRLYRSWQKERASKFKDEVYRICLEDSFSAQEEAFRNFKRLGLRGWIVKVDGRIKGYSVGLALDESTFYIMFETADLNIKGISAFLFRNFCRNLPEFKFINAGDDSGLENLARVKCSYRPAQVLKSFIAERRQGQ